MKTYIVCNPSAIKKTDECCGDIDTSVASGKVVESNECGLESQRRIFALCNPMNRTCQKQSHAQI